MKTTEPKSFKVENFGIVGEANLLHGVVETKGKPWSELEIGQSTNVLIRGGEHRVIDRKTRKEARLTRVTRTS